MKRVLWALLFVLLIAAGGGYWVYLRVSQPFKGYADTETFVDVSQGASVNAIGRQLVDAGVIQDPLTFRIAIRVRGLSGKKTTLRAGEYRFTEAMTPEQVIDKLARGDVYLRPITFPEGLTIAEMAAIFEKQGFGTAAEFVAAAKDVPAAIREIDPAATDLEGYLYPETYSLPRRARASELVAQMAARFKAVLTPELKSAIDAKGLTMRQAVTLASLVEKETAKPEERPMVSAVYQNRLRIGMGLQCDPTVIYALQRAGRYNGNITREDLKIDSPYNTYRYAGLPPGPIAAPGRPSLEAAARPANVAFLYFVSKNDGSHVFASTLEEHNKNVREYQIQYFRNKRTQAAAAEREAARSAKASPSVKGPPSIKRAQPTSTSGAAPRSKSVSSRE